MRERGKRNGLMKGRFAGPVIITQAEFRRSSRVRRANHD